MNKKINYIEKKTRNMMFKKPNEEDKKKKIANLEYDIEKLVSANERAAEEINNDLLRIKK